MPNSHSKNAPPKADHHATSETPRTLAPGEVLKPKTVVKAVHGEPLPNPPHGGTWSRDPKTGDLTLVESPTAAAQPRDESTLPETTKE